jgi:hypothetical protein
MERQESGQGEKKAENKTRPQGRAMRGLYMFFAFSFVFCVAAI